MNFTTEEWLVAIAVAALIIGTLWWKFADDLLFPFRSREVEGTITNWMRVNERGKVYFQPMIDFYTETNQKQTYRAEERCEGQPMYPPGTKVRVRYLPKDPKHVRTIYPKS